MNPLALTGTTTQENIVLARAWLKARPADETPYDTLTQIIVACANMIPTVPPSNIPSIGHWDFPQLVLKSLGDIWLSMQGGLTMEQLLVNLRDGAMMYRSALPQPPGPPQPPDPPQPPQPPQPPTPGDVFKSNMWWGAFSGHKGSGTLDLGARNGDAEQAHFFRECEAIAALGGNAYTYIADSDMVTHSEKFMFITNAEHPFKPGYHMNDSQNYVVQARIRGVTKWAVSIFNDDKTSVPKDGDEAWIKKLTHWYAWATVNDVVLILCYETNERFKAAADAVQRLKWCKQYAPALRVVVGSAKPDYLKQVAALCKAAGVAVELAPETPWNPTSYGSINWPVYKGIITDLQKTGCPTWWGEALEPNTTKATELTAWAKSVGVAGYLFGRW